jgi:hypothetical protein
MEACWLSWRERRLARAWSRLAWRASTFRRQSTAPLATKLPSVAGVEATVPAVSDFTTTVRADSVRPRMTTSYPCWLSEVRTT